MFGRKKKPPERLPWYRVRTYKGDLSEDEKRQLDSFRMQETHPAASQDSLPREVQSYVIALEMEIYDRKQERLVGCCLLVSGVGAFFLFRYIFGYEEGSFFKYSWSVLLLVLPWIYYRIQFKRNADDYLPPGEAVFPTNEAIRKEWELEYISNKRSLERPRTHGEGSRTAHPTTHLRRK